MTSNYFCEKCDFTCRDLSNWDTHTRTKKHTSDKKPNIFECRECNYTCCSRSLIDKHNNTNKHKQLKPDGKEEEQKHHESKDSELMTIIKELLTHNNELKNFIIEQANEHKKETLEIVNKVIDQVKPICNNITNNTSNKAFNINMYLNEQCKDAMNFSDFINGIEVSREDLENNAQLGFVGGVSKILIDNLKMMNRNERPIHCTDVKRETMYIKDENTWTKQPDDDKLQKAILCSNLHNLYTFYLTYILALKRYL